MAGPLELHYRTEDGASRSSFCEEVRLDAGRLVTITGQQATALFAVDFESGCLRYGTGQAVEDVWIGRRDGEPVWDVLADQDGRPCSLLAAVGIVSIRWSEGRRLAPMLSVDHSLPGGRLMPLAVSVAGEWHPDDVRVPAADLAYRSWICDERRWPLLRVLAVSPCLDDHQPRHRLRLSPLAV